MKMQYAIADENNTIPVDLMVGDQYVSPDDLLYSYKIIDNKNNILDSEQDVSIPEDATLKDRVLIATNPDVNKLEEDSVFGDRFIIVTFNYQNSPVRIRSQYRIIKDLFYKADVASVRNVFGINESELSDDEFDMNDIYIQAYMDLGEAFEEAILSTGKGNYRANRILTLRAALSIFSAIRLRIAESQSSGTNTFLRNLKNIDWDALKDDLENELADLENDILGESGDVVDNYTPFAFGSRTPDVITGSEA